MGCFYGVHAHFRDSDATNDELDASESVEDGEECAVCRSDECVLGGTMVHGPTAAFTISKLSRRPVGMHNNAINAPRLQLSPKGTRKYYNLGDQITKYKYNITKESKKCIGNPRNTSILTENLPKQENQ
ncbi:hypothetical protein GUJ93_ZPchr0012g21221 [Zizania palustris]|uniref:Uncharacterized protein n=1 Tax=Zizania palustris TaxID=103762 RepID=A0A8J5WUY8_ZIZPA|nr:hypothetical protein GUJ93_ZPchr0012g21221 [Zizania palustris]